MSYSPGQSESILIVFFSTKFQGARAVAIMES